MIKKLKLIKNRDYQRLKILEQEINSLKKKKLNWIKYDIYLIEEKSLKNTKLILMISILLGLIGGVFFVLISNAFKSQYCYLKKLDKSILK